MRSSWNSLACASIIFLLFVELANASDHQSAKKVFAHYMVCCPTLGSDVEDFKTEIVEAQKSGIDGFALNCGGWEISEPHYKKRVINIYAAAKELGSGFLLFISADGKARAEIKDMISTFGNHQNQFQFDGKPVVSTFSGGDWGDPLTSQVHQLGGFIVPYYYPFPASETPNSWHVEFINHAYPEIDGYFYFGAAGSPAKISESIILWSNFLKAKNKIFMAGITPFYRGNGNNFRVFETFGFQGMAQEWGAAINSNADWVELVTWNDWAESTYISPSGHSFKSNSWGLLLPHAAYLDASKYYIDWFKTGRQPRITKDELYYFYRLHKKNIRVPISPIDEKSDVGIPSGAEHLIDDVFVTLFLTRSAVLIVDSGDSQRAFHVAAGVQHISMPFKLGRQRFRLFRETKKLIDKVGEHQISDKGVGRFNYFSGGAH